MSDEVEQVLVGLIHLLDVFWVFGHLHHQSLQTGPQNHDASRQLVGNPQFDPVVELHDFSVRVDLLAGEQQQLQRTHQSHPFS